MLCGMQHVLHAICGRADTQHAACLEKRKQQKTSLNTREGNRLRQFSVCWVVVCSSRVSVTVLQQLRPPVSLPPSYNTPKLPRWMAKLLPWFSLVFYTNVLSYFMHYCPTKSYTVVGNWGATNCNMHMLLPWICLPILPGISMG